MKIFRPAPRFFCGADMPVRHYLIPYFLLPESILQSGRFSRGRIRGVAPPGIRRGFAGPEQTWVKWNYQSRCQKNEIMAYILSNNCSK